MAYIFYKGVLLTNEEYEKVKNELDKKEQEYLKLLLGEGLESKEAHDETSPAETAGASEEPVDSQEAQPSAEGGETTDSGESGARQVRRKRQK